MANFFDTNMKKLEGGTRKMTARRPTKKIDGTVLSRQKNVSCIVQGARQVIQSTFMKYVQASTVQMEIVTYPFKWKVTRSHADFYLLRDYLLKKYP
jgi:hypothetical protein